MAKIRAIVNGVSFYTTTAAIKNRTVGDNSLLNSALFFALDCMGKSAGFGRNIAMYDGKMNKVTYDIQLSVMGNAYR